MSIFWSVFAISAVVAGFRFRIAGLRYFGLALFALTLLKVVFVDLAEARARATGCCRSWDWGCCCWGRRCVYGKLSPKLLRGETAMQHVRQTSSRGTPRDLGVERVASPRSLGVPRDDDAR